MASHRAEKSGLLAHPIARMAVSMVLVQGSLFLSGTLLFRDLGPDLRGEVAMVQASAAFWAHLAILGMPAAVVYFVSNRRLDAAQLLGRLAKPMVAWSALCAFFACVTFALLGERTEYFWWELFFISLGIFTFNTSMMSLAALQAEKRFGAFSVLNALPLMVYAGLVVTLFFSGHGGLLSYVTANVVGWLLVPLGTAWVFRRRRADAAAELPPLKDIRNFGIRSSVAHSAPTDQFAVEQLLVGSLLGNSSLGLWGVGWALETATVLPGNVLAGFVGPVVASAEPSEKKALIRKWGTFSLAVAFAVCLVAWFLIPWVLPFIFGDEARPAIGTCQVLVLAGVFLGWRRVLGVSLQSLGHPGKSTIAELVSFVVMVIAVGYLALTFGLYAAAWGMVAGGVVSCLVQLAMISTVESREVGEQAELAPETQEQQA